MATTVSDQVAVERLSTPGEYISKHKPIRMGNTARIAYGGCTIAVAVAAACDSVENPAFSLYSAMGNFLGPASIDLHLYCTVTTTRQTRSFATRRVQVSQRIPKKKKNGNKAGEEKEEEEESRICLDLLVDFHIPERPVPGNPFNDYSAPPSTPWPHPEDCPSLEQQMEALKKRGVVTEQQTKEFLITLGAAGGLFETRYCPNGVSGQTLGGIASGPHVKTTQDGLALTDKTSAEWQRARGNSSSSSSSAPGKNKNAQTAALAFLMDGALSFLPLTHSDSGENKKMWFHGTEDLELLACSSLDFALRVFVPTEKVRMEEWMLKERKTSRGGGGRTYSESRLYNEKGEMVANMTQQSIMRVVERKKKKEEKEKGKL